MMMYFGSGRRFRNVDNRFSERPGAVDVRGAHLISVARSGESGRQNKR